VLFSNAGGHMIYVLFLPAIGFHYIFFSAKSSSPKEEQKYFSRNHFVKNNTMKQKEESHLKTER
jgi:hypothetical protein